MGWLIVGLIAGSGDHADGHQVNVIAGGICLVAFLLIFGCMDWWQNRHK